MNHIHQHHTVARNVEQLILEIPVYISRLEELCDTIDEKIGWKEFKFCFKFLTSQVVSGLYHCATNFFFALNIFFLFLEWDNFKIAGT